MHIQGTLANAKDALLEDTGMKLPVPGHKMQMLIRLDRFAKNVDWGNLEMHLL
jgi:hypothetical protein